ncbi:MAG: sel1 repeat family protein [Planctomycetaceae bacterium]|nr:sel1 repeat family protein [Planctomycetaceae bacterium]
MKDETLDKIFESPYSAYTVDIDKVRADAEKGDVNCQYMLAVCYADGMGVPADCAEAFQWCLKAAEQGLAEAQYQLGVFYSNGTGVHQNYAEGIKWFSKAAEQKYTPAQKALDAAYGFVYGFPLYEDSGTVLREAAENGDVQSQFRLGSAYDAGIGVPQDYSEAVKWYTKAAEQGGGEGKGACAKNMLGYIYLRGHGVDKDEVKALSLFMEAAEDGCSHAPDSVGECYENGYGAERNLTEALKWYQKGAAIGDDTAAENFERLKNLID